MGSGHLDKDSAPSADEIVEEAQRRIQTRQQETLSPKKRRLVIDANRVVFRLSKHWLALFNTVAGLYTLGAILAAVLMALDFVKIANVLYLFYKPFCHQYSFRSFFLYGDAFTHPLTSPLSIGEMAQQSSFTGHAQLGYKMALCQRDMAIYGTMLLTGLLFALFRRRKNIPPLPLWQYFIFCLLPMLLDGGVQWLSYFIWTIFPGVLAQPFETIPLMRVLTGGLFGFGVIAVTYPYIDMYFQEIQVNLSEKFGW
ncbi:MAG: DUF2085 domain-containing protein [Anaerolineae bacterium]|nr:DUF2085 domain-containing protein [Anaerolineae bacterium]